ncbi:MAG: polysaccharide lyase family 8 super-sandwich domain-containing protein [Pedobacter sp.]|uniref:polysaccharide lyase family 8 super-sandwich domain-containing protein n=1 Tax=Pedobacter sp. TaxID=1411316 RepID=UPI00280671C0|nr:polysaccharide lyase family 8 super-sandwich domain-containing protein [Pedobacter sp.]MDQ8005283.1 polysaccharide lyase family 8 super-sandwich domain-containing protein [Pedobacter sp.]
MLKRFILLFFVQWIALNSTTVFGQMKKNNSVSEDINLVAERLVKTYLQEEVDGQKVKKLIENIQPDGSWPGIDYTTVTNGFPAGQHLKNLRLMAMVYAKPGTNFYWSEKLKQKILQGYDFYLSKNPKSKNWWYNEIGAPQDYLVGLLLIKAELPEKELRHYSSYLKDLTDNQGHRGMNRIWVSAITIAKGCLENDGEMIAKGFMSVASTLVIAQEQGVEGIKIDNSFHQHRPQLYSGGYGMGFAEGTANLMALAANTSFVKAFSKDKIRIFSNMLLYGHQLFSYRSAVDFGTIGRNIARPNAINAINPVTLDEMTIIDTTRASGFKNWKAHLQGADFPKPFWGNSYFWKSDIMTHHGPDYYLSAKVISTRTNGTEMLNGENLKGYNLPLGATNIMATGEEYKNIFPVWDWTRVPGTTAVMNPSAAVLPWYHFGNNEFAGGISDGKAGAIAYEHSYNGVQAKKAYFFVDDIMLCLGAGINAIRTQQVVTSVNQCYLLGDIVAGGAENVGGIKISDSLKAIKGNNLQWVYHGGVGYLFPNGGNITVKNAVQTGSWRSINTTGSEEIINKPIFSLWLNHGTAPKNDSYCYMVSPGKSLESFKQKIAANQFKVIKNDKDLQVVKYQQWYFIIMYKPSVIEIENLKITSDAKVVMMIEEKNNGYQLSVSDPTHQQSEVNISINKILKTSTNIHGNKATSINIKFPQGDNVGNSVRNFYENKK